MVHIHFVENSSLVPYEEWKAYVQKNRFVLEQTDLTERFQNSLGWLDVNRWANPSMQSQLQTIAQKVREKAEVFAVVGLGGSNQGARAVIEALSFRQTSSPNIIYPALYLSAAEYQRILRTTEGKNLVVDIIAKNFKTLEPGVGFRMLRNELCRRYGREGMREHIITTPTLGLDALDELSQKEGYVEVPFPEDIGGRYSIFSPVGLLPIAVAGFQIEELVRGARDAQKDFALGGSLSKAFRAYALRRNFLYEKGFDVEATVVFEPSLNALGMWWRQLFGESEGKDGKGIFPTVLTNTESLHSLGQYMQSGKRHVSETFLHVNTPLADLPIGDGCGLKDDFDYLDGKTLNDLNEAAYQATVKAHSEGGVPCHVIEMDVMDEYHLGMYMYAMMRACYDSALVLGVNPFDQPGVEAYKKEMFQKLKERN